MVKNLAMNSLPPGKLPIGVDPSHFYFTATQEEFRTALIERTEMNHGLPVLPPEAFDRESIYADY